MVAPQISFFKVLGVFGIIILLIVWGGGIIIGGAKAIRDGDWTGVLKETGGKIFALDSNLAKETQILLSEDKNMTSYDRSFHLSYALSLISMLLLGGFLLFKVFSWIAGHAALDPLTDVAIIILIICIFLGLNFIYMLVILDEQRIPMTGVWEFIINLPKILNMMMI